MRANCVEGGKGKRERGEGTSVARLGWRDLPPLALPILLHPPPPICKSCLNHAMSAHPLFHSLPLPSTPSPTPSLHALQECMFPLSVPLHSSPSQIAASPPPHPTWTPPLPHAPHAHSIPATQSNRSPHNHWFAQMLRLERHLFHIFVLKCGPCAEGGRADFTPSELRGTFADTVRLFSGHRSQGSRRKEFSRGGLGQEGFGEEEGW